MVHQLTLLDYFPITNQMSSKRPLQNDPTDVIKFSTNSPASVPSPILLERMKNDTCYSCHQKGHWSPMCPNKGNRTFALDGLGIPEKQCPCGAGACTVLTSSTEKNPGRKFYRCPQKPGTGSCGFFEWCDVAHRNHMLEAHELLPGPSFDLQLGSNLVAIYDDADALVALQALTDSNVHVNEDVAKQDHPAEDPVHVGRYETEPPVISSRRRLRLSPSPPRLPPPPLRQSWLGLCPLPDPPKLEEVTSAIVRCLDEVKEVVVRKLEVIRQMEDKRLQRLAELEEQRVQLMADLEAAKTQRAAESGAKRTVDFREQWPHKVAQLEEEDERSKTYTDDEC